MIEEPLFSVFLHCFYEVEEILEKLQPLEAFYPYWLFLNSVIQSRHFEKFSSSRFADLQIQNIIHRRSTNVGKDIGGKLVLMDAYLRLGIKTKYLVFVHDKKSPHLADGRQWFNNLIRIIHPPVVKSILEAFQKDARIGIVASKGSVMKETNSLGRFQSNNGQVLSGLQERYNIYPKDPSYVAGTMFWVKSELFTQFFSVFPPLEIRASLEEGNVLDNEAGTFTHSWERLLSWIVTSQGYFIKEV
ncbi:rhamnan synthesis F family protein [Rufibacter latericius]|uniref:Glycosyl transferase n=1 Tax=Rufibacter latericius TaxID=2487040 RepID=A0A3M9MUQ0_9BACT|nr:rhamnan synthesis F family protein [Rufibacter latericius]RNI29229.1 hypothetical protein EFB08_07355 [Rufibacter latericius]